MPVEENLVFRPPTITQYNDWYIVYSGKANDMVGDGGL